LGVNPNWLYYEAQPIFSDQKSQKRLRKQLFDEKNFQQEVEKQPILPCLVSLWKIQ
jgi:hypothetical protein